MHQAFIRRVAFHRSPVGGSLSIEEAREKAFHACNDKEAAMKEFEKLMTLPLESLSFVDLMELYEFAPRVAEKFWERAKREGEKEFLSGHLSANIAFPEGYMKQLWNIARYLGVRESFIAEWAPKGGIEFSLIDMMTQACFQWQFWIEQTVNGPLLESGSNTPSIHAGWLNGRRSSGRKVGRMDTGIDRS